jgi:hypothetical protein
MALSLNTGWTYSELLAMDTEDFVDYYQRLKDAMPSEK